MTGVIDLRLPSVVPMGLSPVSGNANGRGAPAIADVALQGCGMWEESPTEFRVANRTLHARTQAC